MSRRLTFLGLALLEGAIAFGSLILAWEIQYGVLLKDAIFSPGGHFSYQFLPYVPILLAAPFVRVASKWRLGGFRITGAYSRAEDLQRIFRAAFRGTLVLVLITGLLRKENWLWIASWDYGGRPEQVFTNLDEYLSRFAFSRPVFLYDFFIYFSLSLLVRTMIRYIQMQFRRRGRNLIPTILVGNGPEAKELRRTIESDPRLGRMVVRQIDGGDPKRLLEKLRKLIPRTRAREIIFSGSKLSHPQIFQLVMECELDSPIDVKLLPDVSELVTRKLRLSRLGDAPVLALMGDPIGPTNRFVKRTLDMIVSGIATLIILIPSLIAAVLIKLDSKGGVFFIQKRVGQDGRVFDCYKFRTMHSDACADRHRKFMKEIIAGAKSGNPGNPGNPDEKKLFKEKDDPRITRVGKFLRRFSLDEVPQILNVLNGDMSLVGPRPPIPYEVQEYEDWHRGRLATRPGITGIWQVSGRNEISFEDMVRLDIYYIENYSLWLDFKIMLQTIPVMIRGTGY